MIMRLGFVAVLSCVAGLCQSGHSLPDFEAASLHRVDPAQRVPGIAKGGGPGTRSPNLFTCKYCTLTMFIAMAFDLRPYQITLPSALDEEHYMLSARLPVHSSKDDFQGMMQRLLKERFGLSYQMVNRKMAGYTLKVAKGGPKLRAVPAPSESSDSAAEADPSGSRRVEPRELKTGKDGFLILPEAPGLSMVSMNGGTRLRSYGETMVGFAGILSDQIHEPVIDGTRLGGRYDIILTWSSDTAGLANSSDTSPLPTLSPWPTLKDAVTSQLGLKLEKGTENVRMLVLNHIERTPAIE